MQNASTLSFFPMEPKPTEIVSVSVIIPWEDLFRFSFRYEIKKSRTHTEHQRALNYGTLREA